MKKSVSYSIAIALLVFASFGWMAFSHSGKAFFHRDPEAVKKNRAVAILTGTKPDTVVTGKVEFEQEGKKVEMELEISVPLKANQSVAVHIHDHGDCGGVGKNAMGHWNPTNKSHGKWGSSSFHSGDIGNIQLDAKGKGKLKLETDLWSIGGDPLTNILDKAIIVHSGVDDYTSQPAGNAGERIGCGVIKKK
ncbi:MAG: superoxide dismutase family protein [Flavisolibacter sp.]